MKKQLKNHFFKEDNFCAYLSYMRKKNKIINKIAFFYFILFYLLICFLFIYLFIFSYERIALNEKQQLQFFVLKQEILFK